MANVKVFFNPQPDNPEKTHKLKMNDTIIFVDDRELTNVASISIHKRLISKPTVDIATKHAPEYSERRPEDIRGYLAALLSISGENIPTISLPSSFIGYTTELTVVTDCNLHPIVTFTGYLPMYVELDDAEVKINY